MADIYKAVFTCEEYNEREVWYVSSKRHAQIMLNRHLSTGTSKKKAARYNRVEYTLTVEPVFKRDGDAMYDPRDTQ